MADAIWNNNYLLSNLDAQKLYAQSPLTTGVSGSSAYIGIEPSARYNETVLWDGNGTGAGYNTEISLSYPTSAFETVKFYWAGENGGNAATYRISEFAITDARELPLDGLWQRYSNGKFNFGGCMVSANSDLTKYKISHTYRYNLSTSVIDIASDQSNFSYIHKVIGINRKEV